jgi:hypothetical protein
MDPMPTNRNPDWNRDPDRRDPDWRDPDWVVTEVRLVLGPARTVGDLLAALVELMTATGVEAHDVHFDEVPEGRLVVAACRLRPGGGDVAEPLRALVVHPVTASL